MNNNKIDLYCDAIKLMYGYNLRKDVYSKLDEKKIIDELVKYNKTKIGEDFIEQYLYWTVLKELNGYVTIGVAVLLFPKYLNGERIKLSELEKTLLEDYSEYLENIDNLFFSEINDKFPDIQKEDLVKEWFCF